ncbi:MAG: hypothetical protein K1X88_06180 [Nannocystaceae bacterium]|nr:hypothetical protein [Nannocystaceae bacterium]
MDTRSNRRHKPWLRVLGVLALGSAAFVAVVGFAHTPAGRPLLRYLPGMGSSCPHAAAATMTADDRDRVRVQTLAQYRGEAPAASRDAAGFQLGSASRDEVERWALAHALACTAAGSSLRCDAVPAGALPPGHVADTIHFGFDARDRVVSVDLSSRLPDAAIAAQWVERSDARLRAQLGEPTAQRGEATAAFMARAPLAQVASEFRRTELRAKVSVTNLGHGRFAARETYQQL